MRNGATVKTYMLSRAVFMYSIPSLHAADRDSRQRSLHGSSSLIPWTRLIDRPMQKIRRKGSKKIQG
jgi:hypothetical protein